MCYKKFGNFSFFQKLTKINQIRYTLEKKIKNSKIFPIFLDKENEKKLRGKK
jgi:hypothetical protein